MSIGHNHHHHHEIEDEESERKTRIVVVITLRYGYRDLCRNSNKINGFCEMVGIFTQIALSITLCLLLPELKNL